MATNSSAAGGVTTTRRGNLRLEVNAAMNYHRAAEAYNLGTGIDSRAVEMSSTTGTDRTMNETSPTIQGDDVVVDMATITSLICETLFCRNAVSTWTAVKY